MSEVGIVESIFVAPDTGAPMEYADMVEVEAGVGIIDDRYGMGKGAFAKTKPKIRHLSLIEIEAIEAANRGRALHFHASDTRRNIITRGVSLNNLVGVEFMIGDIIVLGTELCSPCDRPSHLSGVLGFKEAFQDRGGLRVKALTSGLIIVGETVIEM